jgi:hypothetical protein
VGGSSLPGICAKPVLVFGLSAAGCSAIYLPCSLCHSNFFIKFSPPAQVANLDLFLSVVHRFPPRSLFSSHLGTLCAVLLKSRLRSLSA